MLQIFTVIAPLFFIIFGSALLQRLNLLGKDWSKVLNDFALKIGFPVLIFTALAKTSFTFAEEAELIIANSLFILLSFGLAVFAGKVLRLKKKLFRTLFICFAFGNVAYLGMPVLAQVSGDAILPAASLIVAVYLFWVFSLGIGYLDYSAEDTGNNPTKTILQNLFKNPLLVAVILGVIVGASGLQLPDIIMESLEMVAASVTPVVLIVIGLFIGKSQIGNLRQWLPIVLFSIVTLLVLPALFFYGAKLFGYMPTHFSSSIIEAAMPLAITPFALADEYNLDKIFIARSIVLSTILSIVSLPFWITVIGV